jgi:hypothetical protein
MTLTIVPIRETAPLNDIPAKLREMADAFERGEHTAEGLLVILPVPNDWPEIFGFGEHLGDDGNIALVEKAKIWFVNNNVVHRP